MKYLTYILLVGLLILIIPVSAVDLVEGINTADRTQAILDNGEVSFTDRLSGVGVTTSTEINGFDFVPGMTDTSRDSLTWGTGEKEWFVFDNSTVSMSYDYNGTALKETIVLQEPREIAFRIRVSDNSEMIDYNGGKRIIPKGSLTSNKNGGYPEGIVIPAPFGYDSLGRYIPMRYTGGNGILKIEYDKTIKIYNETLTRELNEVDEHNVTVSKYDIVPIVYPITIDPTYFLSAYTPYLQILLHMNQTPDHATWFNDSGPNQYSVTVNGAATTTTNVKALGNASGKFNGFPDYLSVGDSSNWTFLSNGNSYTWMAYTNTTTLTNSTTLFDTSGGTRAAYGTFTGINANRRIIWQTYANIDPLFVLDLQTDNFVYPADSQFHQLVGVFNATNMSASLYIDGVVVKTQANTTSPASSHNASHPLEIASYYGMASEGYFGYIDEFALWTTALPISELYPQSAEIGTATPPVTTFTQNNTAGYAPLAVTFNETSVSTGTSWNWTARNVTGNNTEVSISSLQNFTQVFTIGNFLIKLNSTNAGGSNISTQVSWVNVSSQGVPFVNFTGVPTSGNVSLTVAFTDFSNRTPTLWNWSFGDGGISSLQNPSHTYVASGLYSVNLSATNYDGTGWFNRSNYINVTSPSGLNTQPITMAGAYILTITVTDASTGEPIPSVTITDSNNQSVITNGIGVGSLTESYGVILGTLVASGYNTKSWSIVVDNDTSVTYQMDKATATNNNVWYTPLQIQLKIVDAYGKPLQGSYVQINYISSSLPNTDVSWLIDHYGISETVANQMTNSSVFEQDYTGDDGGITFTGFSSIRYNINITNATIGLSHIAKLSPKDQLYVIYCPLANQVAPNNTLQATVNTSLPWYLVNNSPAYTLGLIYQDTSGCTSDVKFNVTARNNRTTLYYIDLGNPGTSIVTANFTVVKPSLGDELIWSYNSTRSC